MYIYIYGSSNRLPEAGLRVRTERSWKRYEKIGFLLESVFRVTLL